MPKLHIRNRIIGNNFFYLFKCYQRQVLEKNKSLLNRWQRENSSKIDAQLGNVDLTWLYIFGIIEDPFQDEPKQLMISSETIISCLSFMAEAHELVKDVKLKLHETVEQFFDQQQFTTAQRWNLFVYSPQKGFKISSFS